LIPVAKLQDGSLQLPDGKILAFSAQRFSEQVAKGSCCFVCGRLKESTAFNDEHVIPDWVLRKFGLHAQVIGLPNGTSLPYARYTLPCCSSCNAWLGANIEKPVSQLLSGTYTEVVSRMAPATWRVLFVWCALLFCKTHIKDSMLRLNRDRRSGDAMIADRYDWIALHHIHSVARSTRMGVELALEVMGSVHILPACCHEPAAEFDYADNTIARSMLVRLGQLAIVAVLDDACAAFNALGGLMSRITRPLTELQLREVLACCADVNLRMKHRPKYFTEVGQGNAVIRGVVPDRLELADFDAELFGEIFAHCSAGVRDAPGAPSDLEQMIRSGKATSLFNDDGSFRAMC
jgi:hypothetical protein